MEIILVITIVAAGLAAFLGYYMGSRGKDGYVEKITALTAERDVQKTNAENLETVTTLKTDYEARIEKAIKALKGEE